MVSETLFADQKLRLAAIVSSSREAIISFSASGQIATWNPAATRLFGYPEEEALGKPFTLLLPENQRQPGQSVFERAMAGEVISEEGLRRHKGGHDIPVAISATRLVTDDGDVIGVSILFQDLSARRAVEAAALRREQEIQSVTRLLGTIIETAPMLIFVKDKEGRFEVANQSTLDMLGRSWEEVKGRTVRDLLGAQNSEQIENFDQRVLISGVTEEVEEIIDRAGSGSQVWLTRKAPLVDESGATTGLVGCATNITRRKKSEEVRQVLIHELNHRVKNLFVVMISMIAQTLRTTQTAEQMAEVLTGRLSALAKAHDLIRPTLLDDGVLIQEVELDSLVRTVVEPFLCAGQQQLSLEGAPQKLGPNTMASFTLLLHELATNCGKYGALSAPSGHLAIEFVQSDGSLVITWDETGGNLAAKSDPLAGFGQKLADFVIRKQLGGSIDYAWRDKGLLIHIRVPTDGLTV